MPDVTFGGAFLVGRAESFCARPTTADGARSSPRKKRDEQWRHELGHTAMTCLHFGYLNDRKQWCLRAAEARVHVGKITES
jgi:hypothetical protein